MIYPDLNQHVSRSGSIQDAPKSSPVKKSEFPLSNKAGIKVLEVKVPIVTEKFGDDNRFEETKSRSRSTLFLRSFNKTRGVTLEKLDKLMARGRWYLFL